MHLGFFPPTLSVGSESDYLPKQETTSAKECNPCKAQGHTAFSNQKQVSQCREATWEVSTAKGQGRDPEQSQDDNTLLEGRRLPFELIL